MAGKFFAEAFEGSTITPVESVDDLLRGAGLDDLVGGMVECEQCGKMVEFAMTIRDFGNRGVTCRDHD